MHPSSLHFGHLHLPVYGICAAIGPFGVLALSQITSRRARLNPDKVWDAVVAIGLAALLVSRALLIAGSFRFFLQQPLLVLSLPTVNDTGLLLTAVFAAAYLRWKRLPPLQFLDALAPCAALLWAFLSLGRWAEGTRDGMPWHSGPWQVELLSVFAAVLLCAGLLRSMRILRRPGRLCALGLVSGGITLFVLDCLRLPSDLAGADILDAVQWFGLAMVVVGSALVIALPATRTETTHAV